ncbi:MAG: hypothetical protein KJ852_08825 [Gammaproteobacteria bacterium]|jgi:hypothetical protein|nr:hypothetical protein [Gammaproteobacteria bacterium]MBU0785592.1 hypothetical protein [Gammaproteobacteria bacterium]MBU0816881.1 hypothetical protein [Gammaproteobacteria bacterium]MBU1787045.1 hypothetical protein [Gammaproteobacteria bacterium]
MNKSTRQADNELLLKGILCVLIGAGVLLAPHFVNSPGMAIVAKSALVGWFSLALGCAFVLRFAMRRYSSKP